MFTTTRHFLRQKKNFWPAGCMFHTPACKCYYAFLKLNVSVLSLKKAQHQMTKLSVSLVTHTFLLQWVNIHGAMGTPKEPHTPKPPSRFSSDPDW